MSNSRRGHCSLQPCSLEYQHSYALFTFNFCAYRYLQSGQAVISGRQTQVWPTPFFETQRITRTGLAPCMNWNVRHQPYPKTTQTKLFVCGGLLELEPNFVLVIGSTTQQCHLSKINLRCAAWLPTAQRAKPLGRVWLIS